MPLKNPPHPGQILKGEFEFLGISIASAATGLGVSRHRLYRVVRGQSSISSDLALRLEQAIGSTADLWLRLQLAYDLAQARLRTQPAVKKFEPKSEAA